LPAGAGWLLQQRVPTLRRMDPRTVIATRIEMGLRRQLGESIDPYRALRDEGYARDLLLVCDALKGTDLPLLARQFRAAGEHMPAERSAGHHAEPPQAWAADTSGFGVSQPPAAPTAGPAPRAPWWARWCA
jgi:hypothetical protein